LIERLYRIVEDSEAKPREVISAFKAILSAGSKPDPDQMLSSGTTYVGIVGANPIPARWFNGEVIPGLFLGSVQKDGGVPPIIGGFRPRWVKIAMLGSGVNRARRARTLPVCILRTRERGAADFAATPLRFASSLELGI